MKSRTYALGLLLLAACTQESSTFKQMKGYQYRIVEDARGTTAEKGDVVRYRMLTRMTGPKDSVLFQTDSLQPYVELMLTEPTFPGDLMGALKMLSEGDSAIFRQDADTFFELGVKQPRPAFIREGSTLEHAIRIVQIRNPEKELKAFAQKDMPGTQPRNSGLYVEVLKKGSGPAAALGDKVTLRYKAHIIGGTKFEEAAAQDFIIGQGSMTQGMEQAVIGLQPGAEVRVLVPHYLGFEEQQPRPGLPAYANLDLRITVLAVEPNPTTTNLP